MKIIRNETGRFKEAPNLKSFDIIDISSEEYGCLVMALNHSIELFEERKWNQEEVGNPHSAGFVQRYEMKKSLLSKLTDYKNHKRTFNGKERGSYQDEKQ